MSKMLKFLLSALLIATVAVGCAPGLQPMADKTAKVEKQPIKQDPALIISLEEVKSLIAKGPEAGNYQLIDARPAIKFDAGHLPTAINIPKPMLKKSLSQLDKNKRQIFYCGGVKCSLSPKSAEVAKQNGFKNVKVFYEGEPAWTKAGNYNVVELDYVKKKILERSKTPFVLVDARPSVKYQKLLFPVPSLCPRLSLR